MELAARRELGQCLAFSHRDVLQAIIAKNSFHRLDDFLKDVLCCRLAGKFYAYLELSLACLDKLDAPGVRVLEIEDERRQRHVAQPMRLTMGASE